MGFTDKLKKYCILGKVRGSSNDNKTVDIENNSTDSTGEDSK